MFDIRLPIRLLTPNTAEHWRTRHKRNVQQQALIWYGLNSSPEAAEDRKKLWEAHGLDGKKISDPRPFLYIRLERIGKKELDYVNFVYSLKGTQDAVASWFFPDLAPGQADGLKVFYWVYAQEKGEYAIAIKGSTEEDAKRCILSQNTWPPPPLSST